MMKKLITYSKTETAHIEKFNWSVFIKETSSSSALKKNVSKDKKLTEQGLSEIISETKSIKLLRENEEKTSNEELFTSIQEEETSFSVSHASVAKTVIEKQKSQEKNQQYSENENILDEYINILNHSLIIEDSYPHEFRQPSKDATTSDYVSSSQLIYLKNSFAQCRKNVELTSQSNFCESLTDVEIISLKTNNVIPEEIFDDDVDEPFCIKNSKPSSEAYKFDCSKNISQKQNNFLETIRQGQKHRNKGKKKIGQGEIAAFSKENEILRESCKQRTINIKRKPLFGKQPHIVGTRKQNLDIRNKAHVEEITLKSTEYTLTCNNHISARKEESNSQAHYFCGSKISSLTQHDTPLGSAGNLKSRGNKSNQCTSDNQALSLNIQNPLKRITYGRSMKENVKPIAIEQMLVTVKKNQNIHQGITAYPEENVLIKTLSAFKNSKHISIKSSVPMKKQVKYKHVSRNTFGNNLPNKQLKCSTPVNASQFRSVNFHYLSGINSDKDIEASFCMEKNISRHRSLTDNSVSAVNSSRNQKLVQHQIDQSSSFPTVNEDTNQNFVKLLSHCEYRSVIPFSKAYAWSNLLCKKIGEGSYGEVFSLKKKSEDMKVLKIIPLSVLKNVIGQTMSCMDVNHEIAVCKYMNSLQNSSYNSCYNFIKMNKVVCVKGHYPPQLKKAWCTFKRAQNNQSFNPHPGTYINEQFFVMFEFEFGGETLEKYKIKSASEALSIFHQIAMSLAVAEVECEFEHRDLHLSNVLITSTTSESIDYRIEGSLIGVPSFSILVKIIDFTLSRLTTQEGSILSVDIDEDDSLLLQFGDEQFGIYRKTNRCLGGNWKGSCPYTNIMWLHYILKNILSRNSVKKANTDAEKIVLHYLQSIEKELLEYKSAKDYVRKILI